MPFHPLTNFEIQKYYQLEPKFNSVCSRNNIPKIKDGTYALSLDEFKSVGTHWKALYVNRDNMIYFDSFEVEQIPKKIRKFIGNKNIITNIYRIQAYDSIYWCFGIDFMLKDTSLLDYTNSFSTNKNEKNLIK